MRKQGIAFAIIGLIYEIAVLVVVGLLITYDRTNFNNNFYSNSSFGMIALLCIMLLAGNSLLTQVSVSWPATSTDPVYPESPSPF